MMKKLSVLAFAFVLAACGSSEKAKTGKAESAKDDKGDFATVEITVKGDKVEKITMDETKGGKSKKELGADYNMKAKSAIGKEWDEQVKFLESYIVKNGVAAVKLDESGYPSADDVKAGCTINIKNLMDTATKAVESAK